MPARYLIGKDGVILDADVRFDHTTRSEPGDLLKKLEGINP